MSLGPNFDSVLQAARVGAEWAWVQLYRELSSPVLRYLRANGAREPEDLLGEVFVHVVKSLPSFEGSECEFRAWVFKTARNIHIDAWRREGRRPVEYRSDALQDCIGESESAEALVLRRLAYDRVQTTLARLSRHQREVIFLRIIAGLSIEEVANVLGKSPGAVKSLQSRGLCALHREISRGAVSE